MLRVMENVLYRKAQRIFIFNFIERLKQQVRNLNINFEREVVNFQKTAMVKSIQ